MKIAFVLQEFPALSETFILNQISGLIDLGHEVDIYAIQPRYQDSKVHPDVEKYDLRSRTYYAVKIPDNRWQRQLKFISLVAANFPKAPMAIGRLLNQSGISRLTLLCEFIPWLRRSRSYDIIHCHFGTNGLRGALLREIGAIKGKLLVTFHGYDVNSIPRQSGADVYKHLFQQGDLYTVNTTFTKGKAVALGCPENKLVKLPVGLDMSKYTLQERKLRLGESVKIVTVARLVEKKGIEYAIRAVAKVVKSHPNILYRIAGDGPLRESFQDLIVELGLSNHVKLLGWLTQDEVLQLYADAHIFILSSVTAANGDQEGQGLVLQEAQAIGLPVLSTLHNGIPDGVLDGKSGFLVPERDVDALAEKLNYLIQNPEVWEEMGAAGRAYVEKYYNISKLNEQLIEIYQKLLERTID